MGARRGSLGATQEISTATRVLRFAGWGVFFLVAPFLFGAFVISPIWSGVTGDKGAPENKPAATAAAQPAAQTPSPLPTATPPSSQLATPPADSEPEIRLSTDAPSTQTTETPDDTKPTRRHSRSSSSTGDDQTNTSSDTESSADSPSTDTAVGTDTSITPEKPTHKPATHKRTKKRVRATTPDDAGGQPVQPGDTIQ